MRNAIERSLDGFSVYVADVKQSITFRVETAGSAEEGLEIILAAPPHILLLDHKLPGMSGVDLMDRLESVEDAPLTIMITAYATIETAIQATKKGAYDFLPKPFTPAELRGTIQKATEHVVVSIQARRLEEERRQVRFQFISVLAHELKAPLNAIEGFINLMTDPAMEIAPDERSKLLGRCGTRIHYMRKMIEDLLDLTRIESGQKNRVLAEQNLTEIAREAMETLAPDALAKKVSMHLDAPPNLTFVADQGEMEIIFNNLVSNAVKYNRDGGRVSIQMARDNAGVSIRVEDTGIGLSPGESARLFEDFVRIKNQKTRDIPGSGLGLSTVRKICQLYDGDISVRSEPGVGSLFTAILRDRPAD